MKLQTLCVILLSLFVGILLIWVNLPLIIWEKDSDEGQPENSEVAVSKLIHTIWKAEEFNGKSVSTLVQSWKAQMLNGKSIHAFALSQEPSLQFDQYSHRFGAAGFCNGGSGEYEVNGDQLRLKRITQTKMSCGETIDETEQEFMVALETTTRYKIFGNKLKLYRYGKLLAQLKAE